jgi:hypothetical protein
MHGLPIMKYALYEDPLTHRFALLALPYHFIEGDKLPITDVDQWFGSREEAIRCAARPPESRRTRFPLGLKEIVSPVEHVGHRHGRFVGRALRAHARTGPRDLA